MGKTASSFFSIKHGSTEEDGAAWLSAEIVPSKKPTSRGLRSGSLPPTSARKHRNQALDWFESCCLVSVSPDFSLAFERFVEVRSATKPPIRQNDGDTKPPK
jgi:hypothetical protein